MNGWSWLILHNFLNPLKQQLTSVSLQPLHLLPNGLRPSTSSNQPRFIAWLHLGSSKTSTSSCHLRLLYSSYRVALGRIQMKADLGLHHPGNLRAFTPSGRLQTTLEHHHPVPAQLTVHRWQSLVVSQWSQPVLAADLSG